jgi:hypothetical protein
MTSKTQEKDQAMFELEADKKTDKEKILKSLKKNDLEILEFDLIKEGEGSDPTIYKVIYELTEDNLSALDTIKNNLKDNTTFTIKNLTGMNIFGTLLEELLQKVKEDKIIKYRRNYLDYSKYNFMKALNTPGLELIDHISIERTDKVIGFLLKSVGKNFLSGKNLSTIALPIYINDDRGMLDM